MFPNFRKLEEHFKNLEQNRMTETFQSRTQLNQQVKSRFYTFFSQAEFCLITLVFLGGEPTSTIRFFCPSVRPFVPSLGQFYPKLLNMTNCHILDKGRMRWRWRKMSRGGGGGGNSGGGEGKGEGGLGG